MSGCDHCFCIDVPPSQHRPRPHVKCCKCSDIQVKWGAISWDSFRVRRNYTEVEPQYRYLIPMTAAIRNRRDINAKEKSARNSNQVSSRGGKLVGK
jgi:hypothetical protein